MLAPSIGETPKPRYADVSGLAVAEDLKGSLDPTAFGGLDALTAPVAFQPGASPALAALDAQNRAGLALPPVVLAPGFEPQTMRAYAAHSQRIASIHRGGPELSLTEWARQNDPSFLPDLIALPGFTRDAEYEAALREYAVSKGWAQPLMPPEASVLGEVSGVSVTEKPEPLGAWNWNPFPLIAEKVSERTEVAQDAFATGHALGNLLSSVLPGGVPLVEGIERARDEHGLSVPTSGDPLKDAGTFAGVGVLAAGGILSGISEPVRDIADGALGVVGLGGLIPDRQAYVPRAERAENQWPQAPLKEAVFVSDAEFAALTAKYRADTTIGDVGPFASGDPRNLLIGDVGPFPAGDPRNVVPPQVVAYSDETSPDSQMAQQAVEAEPFFGSAPQNGEADSDDGESDYHSPTHGALTGSPGYQSSPLPGTTMSLLGIDTGAMLGAAKGAAQDALDTAKAHPGATAAGGAAVLLGTAAAMDLSRGEESVLRRAVTRKPKKKAAPKAKAKSTSSADSKSVRKSSKKKADKDGKVRGRGLGPKEIDHSKKGKKLVQFRDKKTGKVVRFYRKVKN